MKKPENWNPRSWIPRAPRFTTVVLPLIVFLAITVASFMLRAVVDADSQHDLHSETSITAQQVALRLEAYLDVRVHLLSQFVAVAPPKTGGRIGLFKGQAESMQRNYPGFQAINWVNKDFVIALTVPEKGNEAALGKELTQHPDPGVRAAIMASVASGQPQRTGIIELLQGGLGFAVYVPVRDDSDTLVGLINGVFRTADLVNACIQEPDLRTNFNFLLADEGGRTLAAQGSIVEGASSSLLVRFPVKNGNSIWTLAMAPSPEMIESEVRWDSRLLLALGIGIALVIAVLVRQAQFRRHSLQVSQAQYQSLVENSMDAICLSTEKGSFIHVNRAARELFGYNAEEFQLMHPSELYRDPNDRLKFLEKLKEGGFVRGFIVEMKRKDGKILHCELNSVLSQSPYVKEPLIEGIIRDITSQREMEEVFHRSQKMEALGRMAGGIAHDFNNLLAVVNGNAELALLSIPEGAPGHPELIEIGKATDRANKLIRQLLALGRRQDVSPVIVDPNPLLTDLEPMIHRIIPKGCALRIDLSEAAYPVFIDPGQLEQIIMNLAVNAGDAVEAGGTITIKTLPRFVTDYEAASLTKTSPGDYTEIAVIDDGHGMSDEVLERIFDPFFTTKEGPKGTGLGLPTAYAMVSQNNGFISVESKPGEGTTFTVLLPRAPSDTRQVKAAQETSTVSTRELGGVLVVDDDLNVRITMVRTLELDGLRVLSSESGEKALEVLAFHPEIKVIVTDVMMEGMSGPELVAMAASWTPELRYLLVSGHPFGVVKAKYPQVESKDFLQKPYKTDEFKRRVRELI